MGKLVSTSPPPIQKKVSWGSYSRRPLITSSPNVPTTYREEGLVGKLTLAPAFARSATICEKWKRKRANMQESATARAQCLFRGALLGAQLGAAQVEDGPWTGCSVFVWLCL